MTTKKYPKPVYAAAGVGAYAYQKLRELAVNKDIRVELDKVREVASRRAASAASTAKSVYATLVKRGLAVVDGAATAGTSVAVAEPATATTPAPATATPPAVTPPAAQATAPAKRTRPVAKA